MPNLYQLEEGLWEAVQLVDILDPSPEGESDPWVTKMVEILSGAIEEKFSAVCHVLRQLDAEESVWKDELARVREKYERLGRRRECFKAWVVGRMQSIARAGEKLPSFRAGTALLRLQQSPISVVIDDENAEFPGCWIPQPDKLSKTMIREKLDAGEDVTGAHLERGVHVRYR